ncbi:MAG: hypothetical protein D6E12_05680, partial [Desulfovibrio sp.]
MHCCTFRFRLLVGLFCMVLLVFFEPSHARAGLGSESRFGIDYVFPLDERYQQAPIAEQLARTGAGWVNFALVGWNQVEPTSPQAGQHQYEWDELDAAVRHWQAHGFHLVFTLRMGKGWFSGPHSYAPEGLPLVARALMENADRLPKPEHLEDYASWVAAVVERYDHDGVGDMPGLVSGVHHYQIGNEAGNPAFWTGSIDDYFQLLALARNAAQEADPEVKIIPSGLRPNDFFIENPQGDDPEPFLQDYLNRLDPGYREGILRSLELDRRILAATGEYDILDAAGNGSWHQGAQGFFNWVRREMEAAGNTAVVWDLESRTEPLLTAVQTTHAYPELEIPRAADILFQMKGPRRMRHAQAVEWYRAEQARLLIKVFVARFAGGAEKVFVGMPMDWDQGLEALAWPNPFMGLLSSDGSPWPAVHAMTFLVAELDGFSSAEQVPTEGDIRLYRFTFSDGRSSLWVAWLHEFEPRGMGDQYPRVEVALPHVASASQIWTISNTGVAVEAFSHSTQYNPLRVTLTPT